MNERTQNKRNKLLVALVLAGLVLFANIVLIVVLKGGDQQTNPPATEPTKSTVINQTENSSEPTDPQQQVSPTDGPLVPTLSEAECFQIDTPYGNLSYPADWKDFLNLEVSEQDPYSVSFSAKLEGKGNVPLFSIIFGGNPETAVGAVKMDDGHMVNVNLQIHKIVPDETWTDSEINIAFSMQEAMNDVLAHMPMEPAVPATEPQPTETRPQATETRPQPTETRPQATETQPQPTQTRPQPTEEAERPTQGTQPSGEEEPQPPRQEIDQEDMAFDTPWGELHYPAKWSAYLELEVKETDGYSITLYCKLAGHDRQALFTIHMGGSRGTPIGRLTGPNGDTAEVRVTVHDFAPAERWTEEESNIFYAMQEELNYLMEKLK